MSDLKTYYADRAPEYEDIYAFPERQGDIARLRDILQTLLRGHDVLEVACGTGFWTQPISVTARSILATDVSTGVLEIAQAKAYPHRNVRFQIADAFQPDKVEGEFTAAFVGFWWSHLKKSERQPFLGGLHARLGPGKLVVIIDNTYVPGESRPLSKQDEEGNTYQLRDLKRSKHVYEIVKNYTSEDDLRVQFDRMARDIRYTDLKYYWCLSYITS